ncbi:hypothetical protein DL96DRAFT_1825216 [Flagelloscypha sp. PMI_526]|nr:hypothetical protein DL96DRAFT_1825216 [Flagelloscypha sp. PMI_526]
MIDSAKIGVLVDIGKFAALIPLTTVWLATEAGLDLVIAMVLIRYLWRLKTESPKTNSIINRSIKVSIQSGSFTSVCACCAVTAFILCPEAYLYAVYTWPFGRLYSNSLLHALISRKILSEIAHGTSEAHDIESFPVSPRINTIQIRSGN